MGIGTSNGVNGMPDQTISRRDHDREVSRLAQTIERQNAELSALTAYLITTKPIPGRDHRARAATVAALVGSIPRHEAAQSIRRIHDAVVLSRRGLEAEGDLQR